MMMPMSDECQMNVNVDQRTVLTVDTIQYSSKVDILLCVLVFEKRKN